MQNVFERVALSARASGWPTRTRRGRHRHGISRPRGHVDRGCRYPVPHVRALLHVHARILHRGQETGEGTPPSWRKPSCKIYDTAAWKRAGTSVRRRVLCGAWVARVFEPYFARGMAAWRHTRPAPRPGVRLIPRGMAAWRHRGARDGKLAPGFTPAWRVCGAPRATTRAASWRGRRCAPQRRRGRGCRRAAGRRARPRLLAARAGLGGLVDGLLEQVRARTSPCQRTSSSGSSRSPARNARCSTPKRSSMKSPRRSVSAAARAGPPTRARSGGRVAERREDLERARGVDEVVRVPPEDGKAGAGARAGARGRAAASGSSSRCRAARGRATTTSRSRRIARRRASAGRRGRATTTSRSRRARRRRGRAPPRRKSSASARSTPRRAARTRGRAARRARAAGRARAPSAAAPTQHDVREARVLVDARARRRGARARARSAISARTSSRRLYYYSVIGRARRTVTRPSPSPRTRTGLAARRSRRPSACGARAGR